MTERRKVGENRWALHAPFRRVMKRPASDMTRESNCAYSRTFPTSLFRSVFVKRNVERERNLWTTIIYSNFIFGAFGILDGQSTLFSALFVQHLIAPTVLVSRYCGISRRDMRKILTRTLMISDKTRGNFAAPLI